MNNYFNEIKRTLFHVYCIVYQFLHVFVCIPEIVRTNCRLKNFNGLLFALHCVFELF